MDSLPGAVPGQLWGTPKGPGFAFLPEHAGSTLWPVLISQRGASSQSAGDANPALAHEGGLRI